MNIPGPQGAAGTNGTNGTNGIDSFTYTTAAFFVPALGSSVLVFVDNTEFLPESVAGQFFVSIQGLGYMQVLSVDGLQLTLQNPAPGVLGIANAIPTTLIPPGSLITLAGAIGPTGAAGVSGGAPLDRSYIIRTDPGVLTNATVLDSLAAGYMKTAGSGGAGVVSTVATVPVGDISGTLPIAKGGTNLTTAPANKIPVGDGTTYLQKEIVGTAPIVVTNSAGNITLSAPSIVPFNYVTFTRRVTGLGAANAPNVSPTSASNPYSTSVYTTASYAGLDSASGFTASSGRFTVPYTGYYRIDAYFNLDAVSTTATVTVFIRKNGSDVLASRSFNVTSSGYHPISLVYIDQASALTDYYEVLVGTDHNLYVDQGSSFSVQRIQA
ncbi:MAG: hypothetical protein ACOVLE_01505 [Pirellula staleyi]